MVMKGYNVEVISRVIVATKEAAAVVELNSSLALTDLAEHQLEEQSSHDPHDLRAMPSQCSGQPTLFHSSSLHLLMFH